MIAELFVIVVILGTMSFIFLKGSVVRAFLILMNAIIASLAALSFFETAGRLVVGYGYGGEWIFAGVFLLLFILIFLILLTIAEKLAPDGLLFGDYPDQIWRCVIAVPAGLVIAGVLLITVNMMPLPEKWPYERFSIDNKNPAEPDKTLFLGADSFVAGLDSLISEGAMSGKKSLATFHPKLLNELSLNRVTQDEKSHSIISGTDAISVQKAYEASTLLTESVKNRPSGTKTIVVQAEIRNNPVKDGGALSVIESGTVSFTMGQVRLICKDRDSADNLGGSGVVVYPIGFAVNGNEVAYKSIAEEIKLTGADFPRGSKSLDFVFNIPTNAAPVMLQFKLNSVADIGRLQKADAEEAPSAAETPAQ